MNSDSVSLKQRLLVDTCLTSKYLFAGENLKPPETGVQLSFANQEGKLVGMGGSIYSSRPSAGTSRLNNWVQLSQEILLTPC